VTTTWISGEVRVDLVAEDEGAFNPIARTLPDLPADVLEAEPRWFDQRGYDPQARSLVLSFHSYLVRTADRCIVVDTCVGNAKSLAFRPSWDGKQDERWLAGLRAVGLDVGDVDLVINTHLHLDHVGWNTTWTGSEWVPTFPNARYVVSETEYAGAQLRAGRPGPHTELHRVSLAESVEPLERHGQLDRVPGDADLGGGVRLIPTPGHTMGHAAVAIGDGAAVFTGDLLHSPIQAAHPELHWSGDEDPVTAALTRRAFLDRYADTDTLVCTMHFPQPSAGLIRRAGDGYRLEAVAG
jgi:glyoxylase-like metal-dependent hydrolase (beta-lactamase superfamily II)